MLIIYSQIWNNFDINIIMEERKVKPVSDPRMLL